jgi:hypothetical protein
MMQKMTPPQQAPSPSPSPPQPSAPAQPPVQAPPGMFHVPGFGYVPADRLFSALSGQQPVPPGVGPGGYPRGPYARPGYGERPPYQQPGQYPPAPGYPGYPGYPSQQQQSPTQSKTMAEQFQEANSVLDMAVRMANRFRQPDAATSDPDPDRGSDDDTPVKVVEVGDFKLVVDKKDGSPRKWETGVANLGTFFKFVAETREAILKAQSDKPKQNQNLPPGYVEVTPGFRPPPGYVAVPVDPQTMQPQGLPQPPAEMPPPLASEPPSTPQPQRRTWGMPPTMPGTP